jgi:hypothetical protein
MPIVSSVILTRLYSIMFGNTLLNDVMTIFTLIGGVISTFIIWPNIVHGERLPEYDIDKLEIRKKMKEKWCVKPITTQLIGFWFSISFVMFVFMMRFLIDDAFISDIWGTYMFYTLAWGISIYAVYFFVTEGITLIKNVEVAQFKFLGGRVFENIFLADEGLHWIPPLIMGIIAIDIREHNLPVFREEGGERLEVLVGVSTLQKSRSKGSEDKPGDDEKYFTASMYISVSIYYFIENPFAVINTVMGDKSEDDEGKSWKELFESVIIEGIRDIVRHGATKVAREYDNPFDFMDAVRAESEDEKSPTDEEEPLEGVILNGKETLAGKIVNARALKGNRKRWGLFFRDAMVTDIGFADPKVEDAINLVAVELLEQKGQTVESETFRKLWKQYEGLELDPKEILYAIHRQMDKTTTINYAVTGNKIDSIGLSALVGKEKGGGE